MEAEKAKGISIKELVREGEPTEEIMKTIAEEAIDLLVMHAHTEGRLEDLFFERSNEELIRSKSSQGDDVELQASPEL